MCAHFLYTVYGRVVDQKKNCKYWRTKNLKWNSIAWGWN